MLHHSLHHSFSTRPSPCYMFLEKPQFLLCPSLFVDPWLQVKWGITRNYRCAFSDADALTFNFNSQGFQQQNKSFCVFRGMRTSCGSADVCGGVGDTSCSAIRAVNKTQKRVSLSSTGGKLWRPWGTQSQYYPTLRPEYISRLYCWDISSKALDFKTLMRFHGISFSTQRKFYLRYTYSPSPHPCIWAEHMISIHFRP